MNQTKLETGVPAAIVRKLQLVRQRKVWLHVASAFVTAFAVLLAAMGVAMLIDWLATLYDSRWRVVLTVTAVSAALATAVGWLVVARRRLLALNQIAGDVDRQIPQLEERWTTLTRLGDDATNSKVVHPAMLRRVSKEAVSFEPHVEPEQVVPVSVLMRALIGLTAVTAVLGIAVVMNTHQTFVLIQRFWRPSSLISATELVDLPGDVVIGRGEPLELTAAVDGTPVERAILFLQTENDSAKTINMVAHGTDPIEFSHRLRAVEQPFEYRFRAGDGQSEWYSVNVADRPEIEKLTLTVTPPAYTRKEAKTFEKLPQRVTAIQKSTLELAIRPKAAVEKLQLQLGGDKQVNLTVDADGWYRWETTLEEGFDFVPLLTESHGLTNRRPPKCSVSVYPDRPPAVKVLTPDDQMAVRPGETIPITFSASDDVGIDSAELLVYDESAAGSKTEPIATIPVDLGEQQGGRLIQQKVDLDLAKFAAEDGAEISYEIRVREDRGSSQAMAANQNSDASAQASSNSKSSAAANSQTASAQNGAQKQSESPSSEGQPDSKMAQSKSSSDKTAAENGSATSGQPAKSDSPSKATVAKAATQPGQPSTPSKETPQESATQPDQPESRIAKASSPSKTTSSPPGDEKTNPTSPPPNSIAANTSPAKNASQSGANSTPQSQASQSSANSAAKSQTAQNSANSSPNPSAQANAAQSPAKSSAADANKMAENSQGKSGEQQAPREATTGRQGLSTDRMANKDEQPKSQPNENAKMAEKSAEKSGEAQKPREATTGRQGLSTESMAKKDEKAGSKSDPNASKDESAKVAKDSPAANAESKPMDSKQAPSDGSKQANQSKSTSSSSPTASNGQPNSSSNQPQNDTMPKRMLDVGEPSTNSSKRMRIKIDQLAGSFTGQQREKLEIAIAPELEALDKALAKGQRTARGVLDQLEADAEWRGTHDRDVSNAEHSTVEAQEVITKLQKRSKDTPYAFVGLQVADIGLAHVDPARSDFWKALQSDGGDRTGSVHDGWQHLGRARELVAELRGQFERARREFQLAESVEKFKTMYQVFIENTQALLPTSAQDPDRYNRKNVEFKLDDEYLARLKEVLEMRRDLQAELARILAEDPRLLRRFMDSVRNRTNSLREELADLVADQEDLNREVRAWSLVEEADRPRMGRLLMLRQVQDATSISTAAGELQSRYQAWMPLGQESKDPDVVAATKMVQDVATAAGELGASAQAFVAEAQRVKAAASTEATPGEAAPAETATAEATAAPAQPAEPSLDPLLADGQGLYDQLSALDVSLRQLAASEEGESAAFAANRLVDTRRLIADTSAWVRQMRAHNMGNYAGAAEVDQYRLAMKTDAFATKLSTLEQSLAGSLQRTDGTLTEPIAKKSRELLATLDRDAAPNQLAAVYALHSNQMPRATERQKSASDALAKAEKLYDELMREVIKEMDKLPVQDPIASLLEDPTLDEILAQLEQELPIQELLGIPNRPSNLRIIGDWLRPNMKGNGGGGGAQMAANQMRQDQQRMRRQLDQAYKRAIARALKEEANRRKIELPKTAMSDWNKLVSKLGDDLRQGREKNPPEQYRRAIDQYFAEISRAVADQEKQAP